MVKNNKCANLVYKKTITTKRGKTVTKTLITKWKFCKQKCTVIENNCVNKIKFKRDSHNKCNRNGIPHNSNTLKKCDKDVCDKDFQWCRSDFKNRVHMKSTQM